MFAECKLAADDLWEQPSSTPPASDPPHTEHQFLPPPPPTKRSRLSRSPLMRTYGKAKSMLERAEGIFFKFFIAYYTYSGFLYSD